MSSTYILMYFIFILLNYYINGINSMHFSSLGHRHGTASWSRLKSILILLISAILIALCADIITNNLQSFLESSGISEVGDLYAYIHRNFENYPQILHTIPTKSFQCENNSNAQIHRYISFFRF